MPLTPADDYLIHQTPETMDRVYTSDRNFYDRYFYGVYAIDGSMHMLFAFGQYPNIGVMDAFATIVVDNKTQYIVRASRALGTDRMDTSVGPLGVQIQQPLRTSRIYCRGQRDRTGVRPHVRWADRSVRGAALPADLRSSARDGLHAHDATRTHVGHAHGRRQDARRSRPTRGGVCATTRGASARWAASLPPRLRPVAMVSVASTGSGRRCNFVDICLMYTCSEDGDGSRWHSAAEVLHPYDAGREPEPLRVVGHDLKLKPGTRLFERGTYDVARPDGALVRVTMDPKITLYMSGGGYAYLGGWRHGQYHAPLAVETETWDLSMLR